MLPRPTELNRPVLTQAQARRLAHLKRSGHYITGYETVADTQTVVFITSRTEFAVLADGTTLDSASAEYMPARPSSGRRRSLRNPDGETQEGSNAQ